ncbi:MAG: hypothetical protein OEV08_15385, partial [Nitrospira sp.]|nr:hypothetical protein [Nitrospira sp.]
VQVGRISRFGLLEMSRQRLRPSLGEANMVVCPRCEGMGHIRTVQSLALHVLRSIQEEAMKENTAALHVHLPVDTATFLLNEKRYEISAIETRLGTPVLIIPDPEMETPHYHVRRLKSEEYDEELDIPSYEVELVEEEEEETRHHNRPAPLPQAEKPAVRDVAHTAPPPPTTVSPKKQEGIIGRFIKKLMGGDSKKPETATVRETRPAPRGQHQSHRRPEHRDHRGPRPHQGGQQHAPRPPQAQRPAEPRREPRVPQEARGERPERQDRPEGQAPGRERPEGAGNGGRRRRRGRRGRGAPNPGRNQEGPRTQGAPANVQDLPDNIGNVKSESEMRAAEQQSFDDIPPPRAPERDVVNVAPAPAAPAPVHTPVAEAPAQKAPAEIKSE